MHYLDKVKQELVTLAGKAAGSVSGGSTSQTLTMRCPRAAAAQFWRDAENLSRVFSGIAEVRSTAPDRYEWAVRRDGHELINWESVLVAEEDGLRFVDATDTDLVQVELGFADAPHELGTEVRMSAQAPLPEQLSGMAIFTVLYRARALLQTGEVPTLEQNPSARRRPTEEE
ncbi:hypothetical protein [Nocardia jinanensis]|uniref:Uncharacterized protein n=1 Tax=Nocardia jinanensis TaxID=382504 RepID=A0A917VTW2_9NOCA|nr:hypothetical protein [Nocardia jinanensis]GGL17302.1 hypothetical protein GCM10011588_34970 [Nocardia jinanensis]